jgi:hypothetical protein
MSLARRFAASFALPALAIALGAQAVHAEPVTLTCHSFSRSEVVDIRIDVANKEFWVLNKVSGDRKLAIIDEAGPYVVAMENMVDNATRDKSKFDKHGVGAWILNRVTGTYRRARAILLCRDGRCPQTPSSLASWGECKRKLF